MKKLLFLVLVLNISIYAMDKASFGLNINTDDLEVEGRTSLAFAKNDMTFRNFFVDGNFLNTDDSLFGIGLFVENAPINYQNIAFSIGLRTIFGSYNATKGSSDKSFVAIPIIVGAKARMYLGKLPKSHLGVKFAYAPSPLTFKDADSYFEYRIEVDMSIIENVDIYLGYRSIDANYADLDYNFNSSAYVGFKFVLY